LKDLRVEEELCDRLDGSMSGERQTLLHSLLLTLFSFLPIAAALIYKCFVYPRPLWAHLFDPEMIYYVSGRELLQHQRVQNVDNPGTPLQVLSALIHWGLGSDPQTVDQFRYVGYGVAWSLTFLSAFLLVRTVLVPLPRLLQVVALWSWFLCPASLEYMTVWSPEILYFPAGALALVITAEAFRSDKLRLCLYAGMTIGLCCAIKFTFLAWVPPLLVLLFFDFQKQDIRVSRRALRCGMALVGIIAGFLLATFPVHDRYGQMFSWLWRLATRSGAYGSDAPGGPPLLTLVVNLIRTFKVRWAWSLWLGLCALIAWEGCRRVPLKSTRTWPVQRLAIFAILAMILNYGMTLRNPSAHYMLPSGLCAIALFACGAQFPSWSHRRRYQGLLFVGMLLLLSRAIWQDIALHRQRIDQSQSQQRAISLKLQELSRNWDHEPCVVYTFPAPMPSLALRVMSMDPKWNAAVGAIYPHEGHQTFAGQIELTGTRCQSWDFCVVSQGSHERAKNRADALASQLGPVVAEIAGFKIYQPPSATNPSPPVPAE
jgi:hypothetical protein